MILHRPSRSKLAAALALAAGAVAFSLPPPASAAAGDARKPAAAGVAAKPAAKPATRPAPKGTPARGSKSASAKKAPPVSTLAAATPEQMDAAQRVYYGIYDCEFKQSVDVSASAKHPHYVEVKAPPRTEVLMKPVLSSTGAVRLEDVKGTLLMVQIASKSMLLNVKTGQRLVDDCMSPTQRELMQTARRQKEAEAAGLALPPAEGGASAPAGGTLLAPGDATPATPMPHAAPAPLPAASSMPSTGGGAPTAPLPAGATSEPGGR